MTFDIVLATPITRKSPAVPANLFRDGRDQNKVMAETTTLAAPVADAIVAERPAEQASRGDAELVAALREQGDERAFRELYRRHTPRLYQLVLRLVGGGEADAEDVVQETWLRATSSLDRFRWESAFSTWLTGIGLNQARDFLRRAGRRPQYEGDPEAVLSRVTAAARSPAERVDLERAIALLPDGYRTVFVLHDMEGYAHAEIAARLEISEGTSKSQLFHARRALRAWLEPTCSEGGAR
jgi:RNA polymerase sigma-70 factor, ECF subfamily